ncbi:uncharacterized protein TrAtP1_012365 [Trichoderma atroviride]|uniref:uncharacterized protein n=1 Tax=Hypocrea atroviridis TaxID=63577 RepID=UPI0033268729|nr:hypothetical protein TrAtP1_012365 [Trichoderma atroviride]
MQQPSEIRPRPGQPQTANRKLGATTPRTHTSFEDEERVCEASGSTEWLNWASAGNACGCLVANHGRLAAPGGQSH